MALTDEHTKNFEKILTEGMCVLIDTIISVKQRNLEPILLTISRRMPHVLFWYRYAFASEEQRRILEETEIITEIALPFINFHPKGKKLEIIIVDDVVSTGHTIEYVIQLTKDISGLDDLSVFVFFADESKFVLKDSEYLITVFYKITNAEQKRQLRSFISTIIAATLPIDVTYPLLYVDQANQNLNIQEVKDLVKDSKSKPIDNYEVSIDYATGLTTVTKRPSIKQGEKNVSYTSLLSSEVSNSLNNDFAKIRVYDRLGQLIVVPYAPNILSDMDLCNLDLFERKEYKEVWNIVLTRISSDIFSKVDTLEKDLLSRERIMNRCYRSLVAMANYLYSLSSYNRIISSRNHKAMIRITVKSQDLTLIAGQEMTNLVLPWIIKIISERLESPRVHKKLKVSDTLIPELFIADYNFSKYMVIDEEDLERDLLAIFRNAAQKKEEYTALRIDELEYAVEGIMESFE